MSSLRGRLFLILVVTTSLIWLAAASWIYLGTKSELERVLDTRLQEAARMVASLVQDDTSAQTAIAAAPQLAPPENSSYERQLSCQIWSLGGRLVAASTTAPAERLAAHDNGFHDSVINGELWRVYAIEDPAKGVRVLVGDRLGLRERLVQDLVLGLVAPTLLMLPLFAGLIWLSVGKGLAPLRQIARDLQSRPADDLSPVGANAVREVRPLTDALNGLFRRLDMARQHEREITAFAAHELRTPLAGIRTQAQIAQAADSDAMRLAALDRIVQGVDRTARLVSQLLTLAKLDADTTGSDRQRILVGPLLREIDGERKWPELTVEIDPALDDIVLSGDADNLRLALRNLHENACGHSSPGGRVRWFRIAGTVLAVEDDGPGIPVEEISLVTQRFYRGRGAKTAGTGLGLSIVEAALARLGASLTLENRASSAGLRATITLPAGQA
jgi:two-component system, OmpR family, sensor histidine kinase QseC